MDDFAGQIIESYEKAGLLEHTVVAVKFRRRLSADLAELLHQRAPARKGLIRFGAPAEERRQDSLGASEESVSRGLGHGSSCAIMLHSADDKATLAETSRGSRAVRWKARLAHPAPSSSAMRSMRSGANTQAAPMLDAGDGFTFSPTLTGKQVVTPSTKTKGMHGQMPDRPGLGATFIVAGPGIRPGTLSEMRMLDVAPTLAATIGLKMPKAEGQVVPEVLAKTSQAK